VSAKRPRAPPPLETGFGERGGTLLQKFQGVPVWGLFEITIIF